MLLDVPLLPQQKDLLDTQGAVYYPLIAAYCGETCL